MSPAVRLELRDLTVRYPGAERDAVGAVGFEVQGGEVLAVVGKNGAGKSTTFDSLVGLLRPQSGEALLTVDGISNDLLGPKGSTARRCIGYASQDEAIYPIQSVEGNLRFFGKLAGLRGQALDDAISRYAGQLEIEPLLSQIASRLSGGERRRVHTAVALLDRRPVVILDEPTAGVDPVTRQAVLATVRGLAREEGRAVLYSTHYLHEVEEIGDQVVLIDRGRVIERGTPSELVDRHGHAEIVLRFEQRPPNLVLAGLDVTYGESELRVSGTDVQAKVATVLNAVIAADGVDAVVGVEVVRPSLETVFHQLVGAGRGADARTEELADA